MAACGTCSLVGKALILGALLWLWAGAGESRVHRLSLQDDDDDLKVEAVVATSGVMKSREKVKKAVNGSAEPRHKWKNTARGADSPGPRQHFPRKCYCTNTTPWKGSNLSFPTLGLQTGVCGGEQNIAKS
ncbi:importin subunit alpha-5 [Platysternon megacephalum]|uniref:Importin subunit alpha-5 n=1 Tax=Platysternon megacephalum TaxID=55544 RepID=A0A4D9E769_9SAUR|nr:importin subunit alpha-5 [Platysternon megacephalum]